jgi:choline-sulfatase
VSNIPDPRTEARYDSAIRYVDEQLRRIVDWLKSNDLWDETALIVTADHGEALHDRGVYAHPQHYMYDELLGVPLIVRVPGREGERIRHPTSLGWLHEIISELGDVNELEAPLTSSRKSLFATDSTEEDVVLADSISPRGHSIVARKGRTKFVMQTGELSDAKETEVGPKGYYRLDIDPKERFSYEGSDAALAQSARRVKTEPEDLKQPTDSSSIDEATIDRLKQLGYAEE